MQNAIVQGLNVFSGVGRVKVLLHLGMVPRYFASPGKVAVAAELFA